MTLDEAIESEKQEHEFCDYQNYHEQIAEWLEDYKRLKSIPEHTYENCHNLTCRRKCKKDGYNMAIDDFLERVKEMYAFTILEEEQFNELAERLKEGGWNEKSLFDN